VWLAGVWLADVVGVLPWVRLLAGGGPAMEASGDGTFFPIVLPRTLVTT